MFRHELGTDMGGSERYNVTFGVLRPPSDEAVDAML